MEPSENTEGCDICGRTRNQECHRSTGRQTLVDRQCSDWRCPRGTDVNWHTNQRSKRHLQRRRNRADGAMREQGLCHSRDDEPERNPRHRVVKHLDKAKAKPSSNTNTKRLITGRLDGIVAVGRRNSCSPADHQGHQYRHKKGRHDPSHSQ